MRGHYTRILLAIVSLLSIVAPYTLYAQQQGQVIDLRDRPSYTDRDLADALFPGRGKQIGRDKEPTDLPPPHVALKVNFETNSANILPQYYADLDKLGRVLTVLYPKVHVLIAGYTDNVG